MPALPARAFAASALAAACGGRLVGDDLAAVSGVRSLGAAGPSDLSFTVDARSDRLAVSSKAGVLLARSSCSFPGRTVIEVSDPSVALAAILGRCFPGRVARPGIHPTAIVGEGATVDPSAEVGPYVVVGRGSRIGPACLLEAHVVVGEECLLETGSRLHPHVVLYDGVRLAARVEIHSGAVLGADGFGYAGTPTGILKIPQVGKVEVGEDAEIGANSCVDRATLEVTRIGAGTKIDDLVMVGHNCDVGSQSFLCGQVGLAGSTVVGDGATLGGQVGVGGHVRIGRGAKVGAQSGVMVDVPDGKAVFGSPAMPAREAMKVVAELHRLPEMARQLRRLVERAGLAPEDK